MKNEGKKRIAPQSIEAKHRLYQSKFHNDEDIKSFFKSMIDAHVNVNVDVKWNMIIIFFKP